MIEFPIVLSIRDEEDLAMVREALLVTRAALTKDWEVWARLDAGRRIRIDREIERIDELLAQVGYTKAGPRSAS